MSTARIVRMIGQLPTWPSKAPRLTKKDWLRFLRAAQELQQADPWVFREACVEYVRRSEEHAEGCGCILEDYSRLFLLLRVMFDVPSEPYDPARHPAAGPPIAWLGGAHRNAEMSEEQAQYLGSFISYPIIWTREGPEIIEWLATLNGSLYDPDKDLDMLQANYPFRNVRPIIDVLAGTKETKVSPVTPQKVQDLIDGLVRGE